MCVESTFFLPVFVQADGKACFYTCCMYGNPLSVCHRLPLGFTLALVWHRDIKFMHCKGSHQVYALGLTLAKLFTWDNSPWFVGCGPLAALLLAPIIGLTISNAMHGCLTMTRCSYVKMALWTGTFTHVRCWDCASFAQMLPFQNWAWRHCTYENGRFGLWPTEFHVACSL